MVPLIRTREYHRKNMVIPDLCNTVCNYKYMIEFKYPKNAFKDFHIKIIKNIPAQLRIPCK